MAPISIAVAEEFSRQNRGIRVPVGTSGTGGGFKKFCNDEIDICDASRPISASEIELCKSKGIEYLELKVGVDGVTVVVHPENNWVESLSIDELKKVWETGSALSKWSEINPAFPDHPLKLFGPDTDSGTFEYFTEEVCGKKGASRSDYQQSGDDNFLVTGVASDKYALGYFGYAYYRENSGKVKAVPIIGESGVAVTPSPETIESGEYAPLSRPLYLYVRTKSLSRPEFRSFIEYYLSEEGQVLVEDAGYVRLNKEQFAAEQEKLKQALAAAAN